jgi:GcrA cell cycle regulator
MEWTEETISLLRSFWEEGLPTAEIGRRLGITKNAVIGKAHRLVLPPRPSPIPAMRAAEATESGHSPAPPLVRKTSPSAPRAPLSRGLPPQRETAPQPPFFRRAQCCCWPLGEPGKPGFHFCDAPALPTKPYCAAHAEIAYVKIREKREEAA